MSLRIGPHSPNPPIGNEDCGIVRTIAKKTCNIPIFSQPFAASQVLRSAWMDTSTDGTTAVSVSAYSTSGCTIQIQQTEDLASGNASGQIINGGNTTQSAATNYIFQGVVTARYWRVVVTNVSVAGNTIYVLASTGNNGVIITGEVNAGTSSVRGLVPIAPLSGLVAADASTPEGMSAYGGNFQNQPVSVAPFLYTGSPATGANANGQRTPGIFKGGQGGSAAGAFNIWQPQLTKKIRAMKYMVEIAEDATITSGPKPINVGFRFGLPNSLAATIQSLRANIFDYQHRMVLPANVIATGFDGYVSPWVDLGNGVISQVAGQSLFCGINTPAPASGVTPTWTLATTGQWEAGAVAFTTSGNLGAFRLVQAYPLVAGTSTAQSASNGNGRGNLIIVITRTTNIAAGVPTMTITDTAVNSWTNLTAINNTSDTGPTNGSSLMLSYCLSAAGTDANLGANVIIATTTTHLATVTSGIVLEYENMGGAIDGTAQATGTGNSTAPAASSYSPTSVGTLILSYMATGTNQATCPLMATAGFFATSENGSASTPCIAIADNFGNGALSAGLVNVLVCGTEE